MFRSSSSSSLALALALTLVLSTIVDSTARAETVTFTDTVRVVMGSRESQDEVRVYATQEAKRRVLDQVGVYLSGSTEIVRKVQESFGTGEVRRTAVRLTNDATSGLGGRTTVRPTGTFSDTTSVLQRIQTLTVGVVQTEVVSEEWKTEGGAFVLYLVCRVKVDPEDALNRLTELLKDKEKVEDYQKVQVEVERLRGELAQLRTDLENAKSEKETKAVKEEVRGKINGLGATDWFEKGNAGTDSDNRIACYTFAIQLNPNWSLPYRARGAMYEGKGDYDSAIKDFSQALLIGPNIPIVHYFRALAYGKKGDFDRSIADYNRVLQFEPNNMNAYLGRGSSYSNKGDYDRGIEDLSRALQLDPNCAIAYYNRGIAYYYKNNILSARQDFQRASYLGDEDAKRVLESLR